MSFKAEMGGPPPRRQRSVCIHGNVREAAEGPRGILRYLSVQLEPENLRLKGLRALGIRVM